MESLPDSEKENSTDEGDAEDRVDVDMFEAGPTEDLPGPND